MSRPGVTEFTRVSELLPKPTFDVPEAESQALATDIQGQLANLPTSIPDIETYRKVVESLPLLKKAEDKVVAFFADPPLWQDYVDKWEREFGEQLLIKASPSKAWGKPGSDISPYCHRVGSAQPPKLIFQMGEASPG